MSVGVVDKTTGDRIPTAGNPLDKVGNLANLTTTAKGSAVEAINEVNATKANQTQMATVEASTTASKAYSANDYLVLGGVLYKVTANIAQGGTIVTEGAGKNVNLATVGGELSAINSNLTNLSTVSDISSQFTIDDTKVAFFQAYRCCNVVEIGIRTGSGEHASAETLVTIPTGLRPAVGKYSALFNWSNDSLISTATAYISPSDGTIKTNGTYNAIGYMQFSYIIGN